jgi:hypothetical protein
MGTRQLWLRAVGAHRFKPPENDNRVTVCLPLAPRGSGCNLWPIYVEVLETNRPSRPLSGPLQPRHTSWPDTDAASASARTSVYRAPQFGQANGSGFGVDRGSISAIRQRVN